MKFDQIIIPHINVNDTEVTLIEKKLSTGEFVQQDQLVCSVESTKAVVEIFSDYEGFILYVSDEGSTLKIGEPIAYVFSSAGSDFDTVMHITLSADGGCGGDAVRGLRGRRRG